MGTFWGKILVTFSQRIVEFGDTSPILVGLKKFESLIYVPLPAMINLEVEDRKE